MARPAALGPMQTEAARKMRHTAGVLDHDHPETVAGAHVRDAARLTETGRHDGAKRHLDAAMQLLTPQNLVRHGIRDDEGHATAKHHMHQVHRHLLHVQDIEDVKNRNEEIRTALRAARGQISATDAAAAAGPPQPGHAPPQQPVQLATPGRQYRFRHGWIPVIGGSKPVTETPMSAGWSRAEDSAHLDGKQVVGTDAKGGTFIGTYIHPGQVAPRHQGAVQARYVREATPQDRATFARAAARRRANRPGLLRQLAGHGYGLTGGQGQVIDLKASTAWMHEKRNPATGEWMSGGLRGQQVYGVKGAPLGRHISHEEMLGALDVFSKTKGYVPPEKRHKVPGFFGTEGSVFGKKLSMKEAVGAAAALGEGTPKERAARQGEIRALFRSRLSSKAQRKIYDKLIKRGRAPHGAFMIASTFKPGMLESAVLASSGLAGLLLASAHGHHVPGTPYTYKHGWRKLTGEQQPQTFGAGTMAGSFEHIREIEDLAARAGAGSGDPGRRSPTMQTALTNVAAAVGGRDMHRARVHLAMARWANQHEAHGYYTADLRQLNRQLELVPRGVTGWEGRIKNPLTPEGQHPGKFEPSLRARPPGHPTAGARRTSYQGYATPLEMSARTAMLERTPAPRGRPGGPGLYDVKGLGHTAYLQQVVKALIEKRGMKPDKAYAIARARIRKWAATSKHPEVRAAATRSEAGELAKQARAHAHATGPWEIADTLIELATEPIELFNPYHAPPGAGGGQFTTQQGAGQQKQKQQKQAAARKDRRGDRAQRQQLVRKIAGIRAQIAALQAQLPQHHKTSKASRTAGKAQTPAAAAAAAKRAAAAKSASATPRKKGVATKRMSPATIHAKIAALRATLRADLAELHSIK